MARPWSGEVGHNQFKAERIGAGGGCNGGDAQLLLSALLQFAESPQSLQCCLKCWLIRECRILRLPGDDFIADDRLLDCVDVRHVVGNIHFRRKCEVLLPLVIQISRQLPRGGIQFLACDFERFGACGTGTGDVAAMGCVGGAASVARRSKASK